MNQTINNNDEPTLAPKEKKVNRRQFFQMGALSAAAGTAAAVSFPGKASGAPLAAEGAAQHITELPELPIKIKGSYKRMPQRNTVFCRALSGKEPELAKSMYQFSHPVFRKEPGWTQLDYALERAAWSVNDTMAEFSQMGRPNTPAYRWDLEPNAQRHSFTNKKEATTAVKRAAEFLGADLVGITPYDERWVYSEFFDAVTQKSTPAKLPFKPKSVIVMAIEMDYKAFGTAQPSSPQPGQGTSIPAWLRHPHPWPTSSPTLGTMPWARATISP